MNLSKLSDQDLLLQTKASAENERACLTQVLHHLKEVNRRRLFSDLGHGSLFQYAVEELRYSSDAAYRRISAMKQLAEAPELEEKIKSGVHNLTNLSRARKVFRKKKMDKSQQKEILKSLEGKSTRDGEKILSQYAPEILKPDSLRHSREDKLALQCTVKISLQEKIERLKGLLAHSEPDLSMGALIEKAVDIALATLERKTCAPQKSQTKSHPESQNQPKPQSQASIKREVWSEANGACEKCGSKYFLEFDHRVPKGLGGSNAIENLRILCRPCNQREAIIAYGQDTIAQFLEKG